MVRFNNGMITMEAKGSPEDWAATMRSLCRIMALQQDDTVVATDIYNVSMLIADLLPADDQLRIIEEALG